MDSCNNSRKICIIGAGFSGLCTAFQLKEQLNIDSYTIFDENEDVGGTWLVNTYPGCACDIPSHLNSFSFEPNPNWTKAYSGQKEILDYIRDVTQKRNLYPKIKFNHKVFAAEWDEKICKWQLAVLNTRNNREETHIFDILITCIGGLRLPNFPPEFQSFKIPQIHSARWDASIELENKIVAIVGTGASAVQIIPAIVNKVKRLIVYQRHSTWVVPRLQMEFPSYVKWAFNKIPGAQWALRNIIFWFAELQHSAFKTDTFINKIAKRLGKFHLNRQISDPEKKKMLAPDYKFGCRSVTTSNSFYPALDKPHVKIVTSKITEITGDTIVTEDGTREKPELLILATGFKVQNYFEPLKITAKGGEDMVRKWKKSGPSAYAGMVCSSMPNAFFLLGPNSGVGHTSQIFNIECQANWMIQVIREMTKRHAQTVTVKQSAQDEYMDWLLRTMKGTVWGSTQCASWYTDHRGINIALWPESAVSYYNKIKSVDFSIFEFA